MPNRNSLLERNVMSREYSSIPPYRSMHHIFSCNSTSNSPAKRMKGKLNIVRPFKQMCNCVLGHGWMRAHQINVYVTVCIVPASKNASKIFKHRISVSSKFPLFGFPCIRVGLAPLEIDSNNNNNGHFMCPILFARSKRWLFIYRVMAQSSGCV